MARDVEINRALATVSATLNDQKLDEYDKGRVQEIVTESLGGEQKLTVDDGGGLHDEAGVRIAAIRKAGSGEWIVERQNSAAETSEQAIPTAPPQSKLRKAMTRLHMIKP